MSALGGIIGRLPMATYGLGVVLLISAGTGHYGVAGSVSAASALGNAVCAPRLGRIGPAAVTVLATGVHPEAGVTLAALNCLAGSLWFAS